MFRSKCNNNDNNSQGGSEYTIKKETLQVNSKIIGDHRKIAEKRRRN